MIPFALPHAAEVRLGIYDVIGQRIRILNSGQMVAGFHHITWDGRNDARQHVAAGIYIVHLEVLGADGAAGSVWVRKMTLAQ